MKAKIIGNCSGHGFGIGEIIEVETDGDWPYCTVTDPDNWKIFIHKNDLKIIETENKC